MIVPMPNRRTLSFTVSGALLIAAAAGAGCDKGQTSNPGPVAPEPTSNPGPEEMGEEPMPVNPGPSDIGDGAGAPGEDAVGAEEPPTGDEAPE